MINFDATAQAAVDSGYRAPIYLIEMDFSTGTQRWCTWTSDVPANTGGGVNTYTGLQNGVYEMSQISESENTKPDKLVFSFAVANSAMLAACIGPADVYRGKEVRAYLQMLDKDGIVAGAPVLRWKGLITRTKISRDPGRLVGAGKGRIDIECLRYGMEAMRNYEGLRLTDAQQQERFPGDLGLQYMADLIQNPVPWLSIAFQRQ